MKKLGARIALCSAAAVALTGVFAAYLDPHLAADVASRIWACF